MTEITSEAIAFAVAFQRFEYVLKRGGYVKIEGKGKPAFSPDRLGAFKARSIKLDHTRYIKEHLVKLQLYARAMGLANDAYTYLFRNPPLQHVIDDQGVVSFASFDQDYAGRTGSDPTFVDDEIDGVFEGLRTIRNNLFHGGKEMDDDRDPRNLLLLTHGLELVKLAVGVNRGLCVAFNERPYRVIGTVPCLVQ